MLLVSTNNILLNINKDKMSTFPIRNLSNSGTDSSSRLFSVSVLV